MHDLAEFGIARTGCTRTTQNVSGSRRPGKGGGEAALRDRMAS